MNLIEQLKQTLKWSEFEQWWKNEYDRKLYVGDGEYVFFYAWCQFPFEMQEGVFRKYLELNKCVLSKYRAGFHNVCLDDEGFVWNMDFNTFEELILWYFND